MLRNDKNLRDEFEKKKFEDPDFTRSQCAMLNWFYGKTQWWDSRINMYPVVRVKELSTLN